MEEIVIGDIVESLKGRDAGRAFLVAKTDGKYLYLTDGEYKKLANLKKKQRKHVKPLSTSLTIGEKLKSGRQVFDSEIYSALKSYKVQDSKMKSED
ncbi:MAG: hypothetical protein J5993_05170 [Clostridia bacterium]|nr:hypothetical protein [Clostridia bacterium]